VRRNCWASPGSNEDGLGLVNEKSATR